MTKYILALLLAIVLVGGFLRLYGLALSPPSLNWDEASLGYTAYSISQTGKDEYGKTLPVFTRSFDEYKSAIPAYFMIPSIRLFGLNEVGVRLPAVLLSTLSIVLLFLITRKIFQRNDCALMAALMFSIEPWSVHYARTLQEATTALFFLLLGLACYLNRKKYQFLVPVAVGSLMISMFSYNANKLVIPCFLLSLLVINRNEVKHYQKKWLMVSSFLLGIFGIVFVTSVVRGHFFARAGSTNIYRVLFPGNLGHALNQAYYLATLPALIFHNPVFYGVWEFIGRYFAYYSPFNLFLREPQEPVTVLAGTSIFHPFEFVFWIVGLSYVLRNWRKHRELFALLLIAPIPAALTWNWFEPARTMLLFTIFSMAIGIGIIKSAEFIEALMPWAKKALFWLMISGVSIFSLLSAVYVFDCLFVYLPKRDSGNWQSGFREVVPTVYQLSQSYDQVIIDTSQAQPYIFYLFYSAYPPTRYQELDFDKIGTPRKSSDFGKFIFRKINWDNDKLLPRTLLVGDSNILIDSQITTYPKVTHKEVLHNSRGDEMAILVGVN